MESTSRQKTAQTILDLKGEEMTCSDIMCVIIDIGACVYVVNKLVYDCMMIVVRA